MDDRRAPLWLACYALAAAVAVVVRLPPAPAALCTAPLVLLAPGLALVLALGIAGEREHPGRRLAVAVALSMATTALGGLLVNAATELTTTSWTVSLAGWTVACSLVAFLKAPPRATRSSTKRPREWAAGRRVWTQALACVLALMLLGGAAALSERNSRSAYDKPVT
ncbi:MAG TPA: hypothetical protein VKV16_05500, partial [Solirubrobacteraceae bacterium]|nr:hypothetical protein [Solirubrobacteraceae bacterium]